MGFLVAAACCHKELAREIWTTENATFRQAIGMNTLNPDPDDGEGVGPASKGGHS